MKHSQTITPIRTNRNKFNNSMPFRVVFSGTFNQNVYYDLSSAYLKIKVRCKPNEMRTMSKDAKEEVYTGNFYMPTLTTTPVDFIQGFFSVYDDNGAELKFELNNINNEEQANHCAMIEFIDKYPAEFEYNRHIRRMFAGHKGFETRYPLQTLSGKTDHDIFSLLKTFDNKYKFVRGDDGYYYTTMYIPFTQVLEPATRMSLLRIYAAEFDFFFKDCNKYWNTDRPYITTSDGKIATDHNLAGEPWVTREFEMRTYDEESSLDLDDSIPVLYNHNNGINFFDQTPEIVDCDLYMDQYTIESTEEIAKIGDRYFQPCVYQLDNHVLDFNQDIDINKFKLEVPFKPSQCYYYFTQDNNDDHSLRTDYLYLNPPKHVVLKTLTGQNTPYPNYENNNLDLISNTNNRVHKNDSKNIAKYSSPDERFYNELLYNLKKFDHPIIDYESWRKIHRIYSIDMNSDLNMSDDKNTFFFEIGMDKTPEKNMRVHIIFTRDYDV